MRSIYRYLTKTVKSTSDYVDDYRDGANDVSWCSPVHATDGCGNEFGMHACGTGSKSDGKSAIHEPFHVKSHPYELIWSNEPYVCCKPDAKHSPEGGK
jgi:hypothetical protein